MPNVVFSDPAFAAYLHAYAIAANGGSNGAMRLTECISFPATEATIAASALGIRDGRSGGASPPKSRAALRAALRELDIMQRD